MKKLALAIAAVLLSGQATAETLQADGSIAASCEFSDTSTGVLSASGTTVSTTTKPSTTVTSNDPGNFMLTLGTASLSVPSNFEGSVSSITTGATVTGANDTIYGGATNDGGTETLTNSGVDVIEIDFNGVLTSAATAGSYSATNTIVCAAGGF